MTVKKLIEVALPLDAINAASAREKSIRHGHPSTLHLWWARRPLAAARAVIWSSLVDDPSSHPDLFPTEEEQTKERERLFWILEQLVVWENSNNQHVLDAAKAEIRKSMGDDTISLLDPFAGGGAIPLEAQRLGLKAYAQDLNPIAVTINKAMIEIPPQFAGHPAVNPDAQARKNLMTWDGNAGLAADVDYYGQWMRTEAYKRIGHLYPKIKIPPEQGGGEATVIAWLWARTVASPDPLSGGAHVPLVSSLLLSKKKGNEAWVEIVKDASARDGWRFKIHTGSFSAADQKAKQNGTKAGRAQDFICTLTGSIIQRSYIQVEGKAGRLGKRLMAVVANGPSGRIYIEPTMEHEKLALELDADQRAINARETFLTGATPTRAMVTGGVCSAYGLSTWGDLFTGRQLVALTVLCGLVSETQERVQQAAVTAGFDTEQAEAYGKAIGVYLAFLVDKLTDYNSMACSWINNLQAIRNTFGRQAIPMVWDYAEANIFSESAGSLHSMLGWLTKAIMMFPDAQYEGQARQFDAQSNNGMTNIVVSTDPPYYDNISYSNLSDYFYNWMRQSLKNTYPSLFATMQAPKNEELISAPYRHNGDVKAARDFFEEGMFRAFQQVNSYTMEDVPVTIYYAFKQSETKTKNNVETTASTGWETMLSAIIRAGFAITGTWPMRTERSARSVAAGTNALASSIVLVCRKRPVDAPMATRRDFVNALKRELKPALDKLQTSNIAPVDLAQSAIGPGIGVYSRFSKVLEADGAEMTVRSALQIINQELDLYFSDQDNDLDRESRFCVDLYIQSAFNEIRFGEADVLARAKNTSIEGIAAKGGLSSVKGVVRLFGRDEIRDIPDPDFCWLFTQQLTHAMETGGIEACAKMLEDIYDGRAENARALAYRLFTIADKKGWSQEAFAYNSLVVAWRDIESRAAQLKQETPVQTALDI